jgi:RNA exonuclease 4
MDATSELADVDLPCCLINDVTLGKWCVDYVSCNLCTHCVVLPLASEVSAHLGNIMGGKRKRAEGAVVAPAGANMATGNQHHGKKKHKKWTPKKVSGSAAQKTQEKATKPVKVPVVANSNWLALKSKIQQKDQRHKGGNGPEKKHDLDVKAQKQRNKQEKQAKRIKARTAEWVDNSRIVGMDCEMVGVGLSGKTSVLARCSIVDYEGNVLYDKHVRPVEKVTDFRTHVSGIRSSSLRHAIPFAQCLKEVGKLFEGKIIVGHALKNDFQALMFTPPKHLIRDTAYYRPYMRRKMNGTVRHAAVEEGFDGFGTDSVVAACRNFTPSRSST